MRIYIIGTDGITLCREAPATVDDGEIAVASNEELHAAPLSGKRLLALWNALPGVEKRRKVGDREALIDQLWSGIEACKQPRRAQPHAGCVGLRVQNELVRWFVKTQSLQRHSRPVRATPTLPRPSRDIAQLVSAVTAI